MACRAFIYKLDKGILVVCGGVTCGFYGPPQPFFFEVSWVAGPMLGTEGTKINRMWSLWASREIAAGQWSGQCSDI